MRILFATHRLPYAPNRGDRVRAYQLLRRMREFAEVDLISLAHDADEASHASDLRSIASSVRVVCVPRSRNTIRAAAGILTRRPTTHTMLDAPDLSSTVLEAVQANPPSVVFAYCSGIAHIAMRTPLDRVPLVVDLVDVDSAKWAALAARSPWPRSWIYDREARLLGNFERELAQTASVTLVSTTAERETLLRLAVGARIEVVENGVDYAALRPATPAVASVDVVFCGVMNYEPNVEGALWLAREIWPLIRRNRPDARLLIVGASPTASVRRLASATQQIEVTGYVPDVRPYLWNGAVAVAPLRVARGVQNKVLEAVAAGLPVVVTPVVLNGVPTEVRPACSCAEDAGSFADAVTRLLDLPPPTRRAHATTVDIAVIAWERRLERLREIMETASRSARPGIRTTKTPA